MCKSKCGCIFTLKNDKLITLFQLILCLAWNIAEGKVVGNVKDDDDQGTISIVDIQDDNKTQYLNQNFEQGNYNYGYDIKPSGPVGQFHHENKAPDNVVYGCYGYEAPDSQNQMTFYISDAWGYRPVRQEESTEVFYPADNQEGTTQMKGRLTPWSDLVFPDMCAHFAERIASSSNVVTKSPIQLGSSFPTGTKFQGTFVSTSGLPVTDAPSSTPFGHTNAPVPSSSFDVIHLSSPTSKATSTPNRFASVVSTKPPRTPPVSNEQHRITPTTSFSPQISSVSPSRPSTNNRSRPPVSTTLNPGLVDETESQLSNVGPLFPSQKPFTSQPLTTNRLPPSRNPVTPEFPDTSRPSTGFNHPSTPGQATTRLPTTNGRLNQPSIATNEVPVGSTLKNQVGGANPTTNVPSNRPSGSNQYGSNDDDDLPVTHGGSQNPSTNAPTENAFDNRGSTTGYSPTQGLSQRPTNFELPSRKPSTGSTPYTTQGTKKPLSSSTPINRPTTGFPFSRPSSGFSGAFNNPSTLKPSSTNQQSIFPNQPSEGPLGTTDHDNGIINEGSSAFAPNTHDASTPFIPQEPNTGFPAPSSRGPTRLSTNPSFPTQNNVQSTQPLTTFGTRRPSTLSVPTRSPIQTTSGLHRPTTLTNLNNGTDQTIEDGFCSTQCSSCKPANAPVRDEDYSQIPGAILSNIPVIFYPDCGANAFSRPAIVPFCPSQKSQCDDKQTLTMRFPDATNFVVNHDSPVARNAFVANQQESSRVARKVRRGRQQRILRS